MFRSSIPLLLLSFLIGCGTDSSREVVPSTAALRDHDLLACLYFYRSHHIGGASNDTGLQRRTTSESGDGWETMVWPELISSAVDVDPSGEWIYLAAGDGVHVSRDGGKTWRVTGGWEMAEVQGVCVDRRDPQAAWAATAYGVFRTDDVGAESEREATGSFYLIAEDGSLIGPPAEVGLGSAWRKLTRDDQDPHFRFTSSVVQDRSAPTRLWIATDRGVFLSEDEGVTCRRVSDDVRTRRIHQDRGDDAHLWATSDGAGLLASTDSGKSWHGTGAPADLVYCVEQHPYRAQTLYVGGKGAVWRSDDGGETWETAVSGIDAGLFVFDIAVDPANPTHVLLSGTDGVHESHDGGATWTPLDMQGALIPDLAFAELADVPPSPFDTEPGTLEFEEPDRVYEEHRPEADADFLARRERMLGAFAAREVREPAETLSPFGAWYEIAQGRPNPDLWKRVEAGLAEPGSTMFFSMPAIAFYMHHRDEMPASLAARFREVLTGAPMYRGDTENHWVMHYATLLLAAQCFPETPAHEWYLGRSTQSLYDEARGWLMHWARLTAWHGQGEFDSPHYIFMYVTPMFLLYDFAEEPAVKQVAGMMLDLLLADYFTESLDGAYCGGHSRDLHPRQTTNAQCAALHDLFAGGIDPVEKPHGWMLVPLHSSYVPPVMMSKIANRRDRSYVHQERKRVRNVIRYREKLNPTVYKYTYMTPRYCLGSLQGGILQPIQQHTWDVTWRGSAPDSTFFTVHPYVSGYELAMFFPEDPHVLVDNVTAQKGIYASPDKLMSSSPYERVVQNENLLLATYQVPEGTRFEHVDLHVPWCLEREEEGGWWFGRDGDFHVAWFVTVPGEWTKLDDHDRFRFSGRRAGIAVVCTGGDGYPDSYETFKTRILAGPVPELLEQRGVPVLRYKAPVFGMLEGATTGEVASWDFPSFGRPDVWGPFSGPFVAQWRLPEFGWLGSGVQMRGAGRWRTLNFGELEIQEKDFDE